MSITCAYSEGCAVIKAHPLSALIVVPRLGQSDPILRREDNPMTVARP